MTVAHYAAMHGNTNLLFNILQQSDSTLPDKLNAVSSLLRHQWWCKH